MKCQAYATCMNDANMEQAITRKSDGMTFAFCDAHLAELITAIEDSKQKHIAAFTFDRLIEAVRDGQSDAILAAFRECADLDIDLLIKGVDTLDAEVEAGRLSEDARVFAMRHLRTGQEDDGRSFVRIVAPPEVSGS